MLTAIMLGVMGNAKSRRHEEKRSIEAGNVR